MIDRNQVLRVKLQNYFTMEVQCQNMVGSDAGPFKHEKDMSLAMMITRMPFNE